MNDRGMLLIAVTFLAAILGAMFHSVVGFDLDWQHSVPIALVAIPALCFGLDICRVILRRIFARSPNSMRHSGGHMILIVCLVVMPIPMALVLWAASLIFPGHVGTVVSFVTAWKCASSMTIVAAFLRYCEMPISLNSIWIRWQKAARSDERLRAPLRTVLPPLPDPEPLTDRNVDAAPDERDERNNNGRGFHW